MRTAYLEGRSITSLARDHDVSRDAIRTAVADLREYDNRANLHAPATDLGSQSRSAT